jgi:hypothetical protein
VSCKCQAILKRLDLPSDCYGRPVNVGTRVRILELAPFLKRDLPPGELRDLESMVGDVFEIYEIDEHGAAWVEKSWHDEDGQLRSHSLGLASHEMEVA